MVVCLACLAECGRHACLPDPSSCKPMQPMQYMHAGAASALEHTAEPALRHKPGQPRAAHAAAHAAATGMRQCCFRNHVQFFSPCTSTQTACAATWLATHTVTVAYIRRRTCVLKVVSLLSPCPPRCLLGGLGCGCPTLASLCAMLVSPHLALLSSVLPHACLTVPVLPHACIMCSSRAVPTSIFPCRRTCLTHPYAALLAPQQQFLVQQQPQFQQFHAIGPAGGQMQMQNGAVAIANQVHPRVPFEASPI